MPMMIEVVTDAIKERRGEKEGKGWVIREQEGFLHKEGQRYPERMVLSLGDTKPPYAPGYYTVMPDSFFVGRYGQIEVKRHLDLVPAQPPTKELRKAG